jgi:hypothetical protein
MVMRRKDNGWCVAVFSSSAATTFKSDDTKKGRAPIV